MSEITEDRPAVDEEQLYHEAALGSLWWGSRISIALTITAFGGLIFAYFYLRSLNSNGLWDPHHQTASVLLGSLILASVAGSAIIQTVGSMRLRRGSTIDWLVAGSVSLGLGVLAAGFQIWELTRLNFYPGASGYGGVFVAFAPVYSFIILGHMYWLETLLVRLVRNRAVLDGDGGVGISRQPKAENFRANVEGLTYAWNALAVMSVVFFILFYVL
ncbi:MAG: hypothetical protein M0Z29_02660 [Actinomycetota bacterium]|nr:hypothetical protein [Actinomycetota bacterium]